MQGLGDRLALSISTTSRLPRGQEKHGKEYFFLSQSEFQSKIDQKEFAEWAQVHNHYYGTEIKTLEHFWNLKKHVLLDIDVQGAESLRTVYPERCFTIFISPPSLTELERRLRGRGTESEEAVQRRMKNSIDEMKRQNEFDLILVNDDLALTYSKLHQAVTQFMDKLEGKRWQSSP